MEPTPEQPATPEALAVRPPSRIKAVLVGLALPGALSTWGVASVFAASPSPSPAASSGAVASDDGSGSSTNSTADCPAHAAAATSSPSSTSS
jgi:hypothetical protein